MTFTISKPSGEPAYRMLHSKIDNSVNFIYPQGFEARYVHRPDTDYFIIYVSSHTGCDQACRFCHLTQTKQVKMHPAYATDFFNQFYDVLDYYMSLGLDLKKAHINWMARGEILLNQNMVAWWKDYCAKVMKAANYAGINEVEFNFSTIMPQENTLASYACAEVNPTIYYSLYSTDPDFRKRWLPKAMPVKDALRQLHEYQVLTDRPIVFHWAYIEGENDSEEEAAEIARLIKESGIRGRFNLVRYNPYSDVQGKESSEEVLQARFAQISAVMTEPGSRIVPRVGFDVAASCGTFVNI